MKTVINIPRHYARTIDFQNQYPNCIWISICEPDDPSSIVNNPSFKDDSLKLTVELWDVVEPLAMHGETFNPPTKNDAARIVDFIKMHADKDVVVNCLAGVSRSGAIAQFCEDFMGHSWDAFGKNQSCPNHKLYGYMRDYFHRTTS
jgi:protein-tyrosine phosphatase